MFGSDWEAFEHHFYSWRLKGKCTIKLRILFGFGAHEDFGLDCGKDENEQRGTVRSSLTLGVCKLPNQSPEAWYVFYKALKTKHGLIGFGIDWEGEATVVNVILIAWCVKGNFTVKLRGLLGLGAYENFGLECGKDVREREGGLIRLYLCVFVCACVDRSPPMCVVRFESLARCVLSLQHIYLSFIKC